MKNCNVCQKLFKYCSKIQIHCSPKCKNKANNRKNREYKKQWMQKKRQEEKYREQERLRVLPKTPRHCIYCDTKISRHATQCINCYQREKNKSIYIPQPKPRNKFERVIYDGDVCMGQSYKTYKRIEKEKHGL